MGFGALRKKNIHKTYGKTKFSLFALTKRWQPVSYGPLIAFIHVNQRRVFFIISALADMTKNKFSRVSRNPKFPFKVIASEGTHKLIVRVKQTNIVVFVHVFYELFYRSEIAYSASTR